MMTDNRAILAIGRIEQAMSRLERAATGSGRALAELRARHGALREAMTAAITEIDALAGGDR